MAYHHGDLRRSLIDATEALLDERGADGFSLREVARRAGVSPAAPAHHFGDAAGLLTAVVTEAFDALTEALRQGDARGRRAGRHRLVEQGVEYVGFALRHPGRFRLMFRGALLHEQAALMASANAAFAVLEDGVRAMRGLPDGAPIRGADWATLLASWSIVHGFAHLAIAGRFDWMAREEGTADRERYVERWLRPSLEQAMAGMGAAPGAARGSRRRGVVVEAKARR
jgi:AcrR family transcriptional regulator